MFLNKFRLFLTMLVLVALQGCATHTSPEGGPSYGFRGHVDTPFGGVDAQAGIHPVGGRAFVGPSAPQQIRRNVEPCGPTYAAITSPAAEELFNLMSGGDESKVRNRVRLSASDNPRSANYNCSASKEIR